MDDLPVYAIIAAACPVCGGTGQRDRDDCEHCGSELTIEDWHCLGPDCGGPSISDRTEPGRGRILVCQTCGREYLEDGSSGYAYPTETGPAKADSLSL